MDVERTLEFLLEQQAKFWTGLDELRTGLGELRRAVDELRRGQDQLQSTVAQVLSILVTLAEAQRRTDERLERLAEAQQHTEDRLNALIAIVNGLVRRQLGEKPE
ncbi:MAG: hypothetical protein AAB225_21935 [Acidobacteriota bacterium]